MRRLAVLSDSRQDLAGRGFSLVILILAVLLTHVIPCSSEASWSTYTSEHGISFDLPSDYRSSVEDGVLVFAGPRGTEQWKTTINFQVVEPGGLDMEGFVADFKSQWQALEQYRLLGEETITLADLPATRLLVQYRVPQVSWKIRQEQVIIRHPRYFYTLAFTAPVELFDTYRGIMDRAVRSVKFSPQETSPDPLGAGADQVEDIFKRFIDSVQTFRELNGVDGYSGWSRYADTRVQRYITKRNEEIWPTGGEDTGWAYFFSQSISIIGRLDKTIPVVGFYHPWSDVWLITQWRRSPEPELLSAELLLGEWVRTRSDARIDPTPAWLRGDGYRPEQLARAVTGNLQRFDDLVHGEKDWQNELGLTDPGEFLLRLNYPVLSNNLLFSWTRGLEVWDDQPANKLVGDLRSAYLFFVESGRAGKLSSELAFSGGMNRESFDRLLSLEPDFFELLNPVYWTADEKRATLYLVPGTNSDYCVTLRYTRATAGLLLDRVDLLYVPDLRKIQMQEGN